MSNLNKINLTELLLNKNKLLKLVRKSKSKFLKKIKINIYGGYTSNEIADWIKIILIKSGVKSDIFQSNWGGGFQNFQHHKFLSNDQNFFILINSWRDLFVSNRVDKFAISENKIINIYKKFLQISDKFNSKIIIMAFDFPEYEIKLKNKSLSNSIFNLNSKIYNLCNKYKNCIFFNPQQYIYKNKVEWGNTRDWFVFGKMISSEASIILAKKLSEFIYKFNQPTKKLIVLDLDNTLWGGIIGDDGLENLKIGDDTPEGRVFTEIQSYFKMLKERGLLLAIVSKNDEKIGLKGLKNKKNVLKINDFASMRINWKDKSENIKSIQEELNIGLESIVFIDDNPAERAEVKKLLPEVTIPEIGSSPEYYIQNINDLEIFNLNNTLSKEDTKKTNLYRIEKKRKIVENKFNDKEKFLLSLKIKIKLTSINDKNIDRVYQLTNKTNQFNLTTKRLELSEIKNYKRSKNKNIIVTEAKDSFGDYGIISVMYLKFINKNCIIDNWLMSCRVFSKTIEDAIFYSLVKKVLKEKIKYIYIDYIPTKNNNILKEIIDRLGFIKNKYNLKNSWVYKTIKPKKNIKHYCSISDET
jgi:FkbH-like protein